MKKLILVILAFVAFLFVILAIIFGSWGKPEMPTPSDVNSRSEDEEYRVPPVVDTCAEGGYLCKG